MTSTSNPQPTRKPRRDGWTPARRSAFFDALGAGLDVRRACARVGLSRRSAYNLRARDPAFARAWAGAQAGAHADDERAFRLQMARMFPAAFPEFVTEFGLALSAQDSGPLGPTV